MSLVPIAFPLPYPLTIDQQPFGVTDSYVIDVVKAKLMFAMLIRSVTFIPIR